MAGYRGNSMSNNAVDAYRRGLLPASKIKGVCSAELIQIFCEPEEWHHTSKRYNSTNFYNPKCVLAIFGLEQSERHMPDPDAIEALKNYSEDQKRTEQHDNCGVRWIEWGGTKRHPRANEKVANGCRVQVKGHTSTITLPDGKVLKKSLCANGFGVQELSDSASKNTGKVKGN